MSLPNSVKFHSWWRELEQQAENSTKLSRKHCFPLIKGGAVKNNLKVKSESEVTESCPTLCDPVDYSPPGFFVHGILQA